MSDLKNNEVKMKVIELDSMGLTGIKIAEMTGIPKSTINDFLRRHTHTVFWTNYDNSLLPPDHAEGEGTPEKPIASGEKQEPHVKRGKLHGKRFVFTSAQNNTFVHKEFLQSLKQYCAENDAQLIVGTFHYNKNGFQNSSEKDLWYDPAITEYVMDSSMEVLGDLIWCGELNILPTAVQPMSGLDSYTGAASGIIPHAKVQLKAMPVLDATKPRTLYTTGCVTQRNYIDQKAGQKASWHHVFGALTVEIDEDGDWFARHLIADSESGCFYDLDKYYAPNGVLYDQTIEAINYGDIHVAKLDETVADVSWRNADSILDTLYPKYQFLHDTYDQQARNHHNLNNPHVMFDLYVNGQDSVEDEIKLTANEMMNMTRDWCEMVVVNSNHDLALEKWLREGDYRKDPVNALTFLQLQSAKYRAIKDGEEGFSILEYAIKSLSSYECDPLDEAIFLGEDDSFVICGDIECGQHGHNGNNGGRGSINALLQRGMKSNTGHSHAPMIMNGVYVAGVSGKLKMGYNRGGSAWQQAHIITYRNGKRAIIHIKNGKWRA
jgi:hypothetical protein